MEKGRRSGVANFRSRVAGFCTRPANSCLSISAALQHRCCVVLASQMQQMAEERSVLVAEVRRLRSLLSEVGQ